MAGHKPIKDSAGLLQAAMLLHLSACLAKATRSAPSVAWDRASRASVRVQARPRSLVSAWLSWPRPANSSMEVTGAGRLLSTPLRRM